MEGSKQFGLWFVYIRWNTDNIVNRIRFVRQNVPGPVPLPLSQYLAGKTTHLSPLRSIHEQDTTIYGDIYREVLTIPYGETRSYKEIADAVGTGARVVGMAMKRNLTPILVPCHRVVASGGLGGYTPDISIKQDLLALESKVRKKMNHSEKIRNP
ncbi:MAG TPA: methylated-DNA--[protein]-cysteine S-methyltransferase [Methanospirillum sp.]|uniref:methylated-DNA--[protein]-cysteine S-methyltransferase n=1 Tax=Methanospirillum sp. TaxID=45200 RepID=UPI002C9F3AE3|nr:methylated-DNA--[protein]-cysteine S-methyltransferase [Methanospirillum sp.]HOJ96374.1 methylated-DNA--[protein]-cysteine S-methyltransferase [Methanospirillum sp.]HOL41032.1 methylated-DNA--[protein]-cysteine S-methyltransferase [Methanospirillum sp.]HPP77102.1 methylated-DNA--[protein]-cysteine S-methyltransferase [Methanospirillum sp.]